MGQDILDTLELQQIEIIGKRLLKLQTTRSLVVDSVIMEKKATGNLNDILKHSSSSYLKVYQPGGLATISFRGTPAVHTEVSWNGLQLNSPMLGQLDLSTIPVWFLDQMILSGNSVNFTGHTGMAGHLSLITTENKACPDGIEAIQEIGSFKTLKSFVRLNAGNRHLKSSTRIFRMSSKNDYPYDLPGNSSTNPRKVRRFNAGFIHHGFLQEFYHTSSPNSRWFAKTWLQDSDREIPPNILANQTGKGEKLSDITGRYIVGWEHNTFHNHFLVQGGLIHQKMNYQHPVININNTSMVISTSLLARYYRVFNSSFSSGLAMHSQYHQVNADSYEQLVSKTCFSLTGFFLYRPVPGLLYELIIRQEMENHKLTPFLPSLGIHWKLFENTPITIKANISRTFRHPTLNDLYWNPGGNPHLENEYGFKTESGLYGDFKFHDFSADWSFIAFYSRYHNLIVWQPDVVQGYWRPANVRSVVSKGLETDAKINFSLNRLRCIYSLHAAMIIAESSGTSHKSPVESRNQMVYVPKFSINQYLLLRYKDFDMLLTGNYVSKRFTSSDNSTFLPGFFTTDLSFSKTLAGRLSHWQVQLSLNNLTNVNYQLIAWQPMPGFHYALSISYSLKHQQ